MKAGKTNKIAKVALVECEGEDANMDTRRRNCDGIKMSLWSLILVLLLSVLILLSYFIFVFYCGNKTDERVTITKSKNDVNKLRNEEFVEETIEIKRDGYPGKDRVVRETNVFSSMFLHGRGYFAKPRKVSEKGTCIRRRLRFCDPYLNYNMTTLPNIVGDRSFEEMETSLPYFELVLKSKCNARMKAYVCNLLEPKCGPKHVAIPPCKKFCDVAKEGCDSLILQTLKLANVFNCQQYPDDNQNIDCTNLAGAKECFSTEFQCPDNTCIPKTWVCDGLRDCKYAADESNCTSCTGNVFKCDNKCIPISWRCDNTKDCMDGSDETACPNQKFCTEDRFLCKDNSSCIPKRWTCDGRNDCRDESDEQNCKQKRGCENGDFQCDTGICIPRMWRCDGQNDCKDNPQGSDERACFPEKKSKQMKIY